MVRNRQVKASLARCGAGAADGFEEAHQHQQALVIAATLPPIIQHRDAQENIASLHRHPPNKN
jgi:hypothetical protein